MKNDNNNIKTIGVIMEDSYTDFAMEILHSIVHAIMGRKDIRLIIVSGRQDESDDMENREHLYKLTYNSIYRINAMCSFDGLIFTQPEFVGVSDDLFMDVPKVYIASDKKDEITVNYDNEMGIREAIDYLVRVKGFTRICMIGGRDDCADARIRKEIFRKCLEENGISYSEKLYVKADMSPDTQGPAAALLAMNPDVQAIFCVNDPTAMGLYDVMRAKGLIPGKDIAVFGFDNANIAGEMIPPLASIGTDGVTLGKRALEVLLEMIAGEKVTSQVVPTRLYGRESLEYEMYEFTAQDMLSGGEGFIYGFFDNCFYRYRNEIVDSKDINLKRLFYEIISRMLYALKNRYMSQEQFNEISRMIDILFENGVMRYTDASRFVRSIARLQSNMNETHRSGYVVSRNNRLFSHMKDRAILSQAFRHTMETREYNFGRGRIFDFTIETVNYGTPDPGAMERLIGNFDKAGFDNAAMYLYDKPVLYDGTDPEPLPELMYLKCVVRDKTLYVIPEERQECPVDRIYTRSVIPRAQKGYISFPLFYGRYLFGVLVACVTRALIDNGEYVSSQVSRMIYLNWCGKE